MRNRITFVLTALALTGMPLSGPASARGLWCDNLNQISPAVAANLDKAALGAAGGKPNAQAELRSKGLLPGQPQFDSTMKSKADFPVTLTLAYGWAAQRKRSYLEDASAYLVAWAMVYRPSFDPIDESSFTTMFEAYAAVRDDMKPDDRAHVDQLLRRFYDGYLRAIQSPQAGHGNGQSHRLKIVAGAAVALGDPALLAAAEPWYRAQILRTIRDDGSTEDFHSRDSLAYATYTLLPLVETALLTRSAGVPWLQPGSAHQQRLLSALDWMVPYAKGEKTHIEHQNTTVAFDRKRAEAGMKGHTIQQWEPARAADLFWLASHLKPEYARVAQGLRQKPSSLIVACRGNLATR